MTVKGVILAAGMGSRLVPVTPFLPKEMLPICGLPAIHHSLYELAEAGVTDVMIVVSSAKDALVSYLTASVAAKGERARQLLAERDALLSRLRTVFATQSVLRGTADAISLAEDFGEGSPLAVVYPDDVLTVAGRFSDGIASTRELIRSTEASGDSAILVSEIPGKCAHDYGVVTLRKMRESLFVTGIVEKPQEYPFDVAHAMIGRMLLTPQAIRSIRSFDLTDQAGIIPVLSAEAERGALRAVLYRGRRFDVGSHEGYAEILRALT